MRATLQIKYKMRKLQITGWRDSVYEHIFVVTKTLKTEQCFWLQKKANTYFAKYFHVSIKILNINSVAVFDLLRQTFTFIPKVFLNLNKVEKPLVVNRNVIEIYNICIHISVYKCTQKQLLLYKWTQK